MHTIPISHPGPETKRCLADHGLDNKPIVWFAALEDLLKGSATGYHMITVESNVVTPFIILQANERCELVFESNRPFTIIYKEPGGSFTMQKQLPNTRVIPATQIFLLVLDEGTELCLTKKCHRHIIPVLDIIGPGL